MQRSGSGARTGLGRPRLECLALAALLSALVAACGSSGGSASSTTGAGLAPTEGRYAPSIDAANFGGPIDKFVTPAVASDVAAKLG